MTYRSPSGAEQLNPWVYDESIAEQEMAEEAGMPPLPPWPPTEDRHLAGKHDQKAHGHGGGVSGSGTKDDPIRT